MWSQKSNFFCPSSAHRPRSPRQNSMGGASTGSSSIPSPQTGTAPVESAATPTSASSPTAASPAPNMVASPSGDGNLKFNPHCHWDWLRAKGMLSVCNTWFLCTWICRLHADSVTIRSTVNEFLLCFYSGINRTIFLYSKRVSCPGDKTNITHSKQGEHQALGQLT